MIGEQIAHWQLAAQSITSPPLHCPFQQLRSQHNKGPTDHQFSLLAPILLLAPPALALVPAIPKATLPAAVQPPP